MRIIQTNIDRVTQEETSPQVDESFPYRSNICDLADWPEQTCPWHWHSDVELFYMESGSLEYLLPGRRQVFGPGDVGFVNAGVPHMTRAYGSPHSRQQEHIFLPSLVAGAPGNVIERQYVRPLLENGAADLLFLPAASPESAPLRAWMDAAYAAFQEGTEGYEITVRESMSRIWLALLRLAPDGDPPLRGQERARIKAMLGCIEARCGSPLTLAEIAAAANIGEREADRCFRRQLGTTPFAYLLDCRLERACRLLREGELPITEIGLRCGFSSASYFGLQFRKKLGCSPLAYRKRERA